MWMFIAKGIVIACGVVASLYAIAKTMKPPRRVLEIDENTDVRTLLITLGLPPNEADEVINDEEKLGLMLRFIAEYLTLRIRSE